MKSYNIYQLLGFIDSNTPFTISSVRSASFIEDSTFEFRVMFNDQTEYYINMDQETYWKID